MAPHATIALDQELALINCAERLAREFEGVFGSETIKRFPPSSRRQLAEHATAARCSPASALRNGSSMAQPVSMPPKRDQSANGLAAAC